MRVLGAMSEVKVILAVVFVAAVTAVLAPVATNGVFADIRHAVLWPLFVAPGWAICRVLLPAERLTLTERLAISGAISIAVIVILGLCINALPGGLDRSSWTWGLIGVTVVALAAGLSVGSIGASPEKDGARWSVGLYAGLVVAVALMASGLVIATHSAAVHYRADHFSQLWALPGRSRRTVEYGVVNHEGRSQQYLLTIGKTNRSQPLGRFRFTLRDGESRTGSLSVRQISSRVVLVRLFRSHAVQGKPYLSTKLVMKNSSN